MTCVKVGCQETCDRGIRFVSLHVEENPGGIHNAQAREDIRVALPRTLNARWLHLLAR